MLNAIVLNDTSHMHHHGCRRVMANLRAGLARHGIDVTRSWHGVHWQTDPAFFSALKTADALIVNGEGTIHHNRAAAKALVMSARIASDAGCPAFLINTTWHANSPELAVQAQQFRRIYVRESLSLAELAAARTDARVVPDLTFLSGSHGSHSQSAQFGVTDSTKKRVNKCLFAFASAQPECHFIPVLAPFESKRGMPRRLKKTARHLACGFLARVPILRQTIPVHYRALEFAESTAEAYLNRIATCAGVVTGRFHALCFALQAGTPFLAIKSNSHKIEGLLRDVGLPESRLIDPGHLTDSLTLRSDLSAFNAWESAQIQKDVDEAPDVINGMFAEIASACGVQHTTRRSA